jgi:ferrous iron transport protein A
MIAPSTLSLGDARVGFRGRIAALDVARATDTGLAGPELERRLIELGFVEGAEVELLHEGLFGRDPIAVRVANTTIALRRQEARAIMVALGLPT